MNLMIKLLNNFGSAAFQVIGAKEYCRLLYNFLFCFPKIIRQGNLSSLDKVMGSKVMKIHYHEVSFAFDCLYCDQTIHDGSFSFGVIRELYIRNCYFRYLPPEAFHRSKVVFDIGANRGAFSTLMASTADLVVAVEAQPQFIPVIAHNLQKNGFDNCRVENAFVGSGGELDAQNYSVTSIDELLSRYKLDKVDLIKLDIEGSEFSLFRSANWLKQVNYVSMEIHPAFGDLSIILNQLNKYGFKYLTADANLKLSTNSHAINFVYAWKV